MSKSLIPISWIRAQEFGLKLQDEFEHLYRAETVEVQYQLAEKPSRHSLLEEIFRKVRGRDIVFQPHPFPYFFEKDVFHGLLWFHPNSHSQVPNARIREIVRSLPYEIVWYEDPSSWKTTQEVLYVHIFIRQPQNTTRIEIVDLLELRVNFPFGTVPFSVLVKCDVCHGKYVESKHTCKNVAFF